MTTQAELCRITVIGPTGRADLAVPVATTVTALLPTLVKHVVRDQDKAPEGDGYGTWVLQRLGDAPFEPDGTPETLDWLDGEQLHLVRAEDPLPELDFDDIAEGMATAVNRQGNRWNETVNRKLFLSLAGCAFGAIALSLLENQSTAIATATAGVLALILVVAAVLVARTLRDRGLAAVVGVAGCGYAGLAGTIGLAGVAGAMALDPVAVLVGGGIMALVASGLLVVQRILARDLPIIPFGATAVVGIGAVLATGLYLGAELTRPQTTTVVMAVVYLLLLFSPKLATRAARLRGPQLPRTAEEMKIDVEPMPAATLVEQTGIADRYLSVLAIGGSVVFAVGFWYLMVEPTWLDHTLGGLFAALILLRSREFLNVAQRTAFALAGTWGAVLPSLIMLAGMSDMSRLFGVLGMLVAVLLLIAAALRPAHRRMLPIWPHMGDVVENLTCIALVPFVLQVLGVFAWARGLAG
ncbi:type VII secretion integral membrane protein EccD [Actinokineospora alba]|uniref:Type VII secretion integral membrane protein EccD n=1 Tax=Actinokineospora alba TaxID=504798 RepID=A0A1H0WPK2_9PSEU|nr:type VII secretion integral membrane protein EccD [Actinokineospora alba]TDP67185.1 type VII secretion integral membrane protein EccD [Actinokineospora alba]SDJ54366.1 type VII secretion integral membrane protein EccD [Actinokineospora alba]SDP92196.1 type VII secretion integral membrane protein EccD [Actinokineospora alba]